MIRTSEDTLVEEAKAGDALAFRKIVETYQEDVLVTVIGILGKHKDVEDVVQEVFIKLHGSLPRFEGRSSLKTYLTRIAINKSLDALRSRQRRRNRETSLEDSVFVASVNSNDTDITDKDMVWRAIDSLPDKFRPVVVLRMIDGYSTQETADILDVKYGTVLSRLSRALDQMKSLLETTLENDGR